MQSFQIILLPIILGNLSFCQEDCSLMSWPVALVNFLDCYSLHHKFAFWKYYDIIKNIVIFL